MSCGVERRTVVIGTHARHLRTAGDVIGQGVFQQPVQSACENADPMKLVAPAFAEGRIE